jgi:hypothetical protein
LPANPIPISLARLRARLNFGNKSIYSQNQLVRKGMKTLEELGYLSYSEIKKNRSVFFSIHHRNPKLKTVSEVDAIPPEIKKPTDQTSLAKKGLSAYC